MILENFPIYESFAVANTVMLWSAFGIAFIMGAVVNKTNWCTMGAISDLVNIGDTGRWRSWLFAMMVAIVGLIVIEKLGLIVLDTVDPLTNNPAKPNYRRSSFPIGELIIGGLMFGIGMTLGSGCGNKTLIRIGGGNLKSVFVLLIMGFFAYWMILDVYGTNLQASLFSPWTKFLTVDFPVATDLGSLASHYSGASNAIDLRLYIGGGIAGLLFIYIIMSKDFFGKFDNILGGLVVGLAVVALWFMTGSAKVNAYDEMNDAKSPITIANYSKQSNWSQFQVSDSERTEKSDQKAIRPDWANRVVGPQSMTFISPSAWIWNMGLGPIQKKDKPFSSFLNVPVMLLFGIIVGSLFWSLISRSFRIEWFASFKDFSTHVIGAVLMGVGGVLGLGCTIGQGITGISTLAIGSLVVLISIVLGCALTMKVQLYKMVYDDAGFFTALGSAMADMKLLPKSFKKLESI